MFVILWRFAVRPGAREAFERHYGPEGTWARFFRTGPGFLGTDLLKDREAPLRYVTEDRWTTEESFEDFKKRNAARYGELDRDFEALTESQECLGSFTCVRVPSPGEGPPCP